MTQLAFPLARPVIDESGMTDDERKVVRALDWGREKAKRIERLASETGLNPRRVQSIVRALREDHAVPVGASFADPYGDYLIDDPEELADVFATFRARGLSNLRQAAKLKGDSLKRFLAEIQTELDAA